MKVRNIRRPNFFRTPLAIDPYNWSARILYLDTSRHRVRWLAVARWKAVWHNVSSLYPSELSKKVEFF